MFSHCKLLLVAIVAFETILTQSSIAQDKPKGATDDFAVLDPAEATREESKYITDVKQLTLDGVRSGEGYFSHDGKAMVFQSEREPGNPFYQIYYMDRETGDVERVSPGHGKTTCAWIHPDGKKVLFASTQFDPKALDKQKEEYRLREEPKARRYAWDYDENYELIEWNRETKEYKRITSAVGYDAEACYSPDGNWIAFSSNRRAYNNELTPKEKELFANDQATAADLYIMKSDGTDVRRLTTEIGYDGGPFFSADGKKICYRHFDENGLVAEIYTMDVTGDNPKRLTSLNVMSWAPFFHPSGDYLVFATNKHGFTNFEVYMVDANGKQEPQRITFTDGFDGLPVFTPDGNELVWTTNRTSNKKSQLFTAKWNDAEARKALKIDQEKGKDSAEDKSLAQENAAANQADFSAADIGRHIDYLCRPELGGRLTGTEGEKRATAYVAAYLDSLGLEPAGVEGGWYQPFPFTAGANVGKGNELKEGDTTFEVDKDWRPVAFTKNGEVEPTEIVFAGYGIVAPKDGANNEYDSYVHLDVENKWVMVYRQHPSDVPAEQRQHLARFASLRYKAMMARDRGAKGLIVVSGPASGVRNQLVPLAFDGSFSGTSIAVISVTDAIGKKWLDEAGEDLGKIQKELDKGELMMGIAIPKRKLSAKIEVEQVKKEGRNVLGVLRAGDKPSNSMIVVGAHIDHLGSGDNGSSLAKEDERGGVHRGADDNASGVAGMLEIAQYLASQKKAGKLKLEHDILFAAWSGEELGLIGSAYFADEFYKLYPRYQASDDGKLYPAVGAALNLDMIGRLRDTLVVQGIGSSKVWTPEIEKRNAVVRMALTLQDDCYLPTDASTFYMKGVPILSAFTGSHSEYHTPRDTPELINYEGAAQSAKLFGLVARALTLNPELPGYQQQVAPENQGKRASLLASLGSIPDYSKNVKGVYLGGVGPGGPASKAGIKGGDIVVEVAGKKIENIYDYTFAIDSLKVGEEVEVAVKRGEEILKFKVTTVSRQ